MLFLCRGMWGWARTLTAPSNREQSTRVPSRAPSAPCEREAVIRVLAAMAIDTHDRRAS